MVRARRARWEGVREEPVWEASLSGAGSNLTDLGRWCGAWPLCCGGVTRPGSSCDELGQPGRKVCGVLPGAAGVKPGA
jgi:hypothetical protein